MLKFLPWNELTGKAPRRPGDRSQRAALCFWGKIRTMMSFFISVFEGRDPARGRVHIFDIPSEIATLEI
jgi:hypothetical protein